MWLGVTRVGGVVALLNTNLTGPVAGPLHQRRGAPTPDRRRGARRSRSTAVRHDLASAPKVWVHGGDGDDRFRASTTELERHGGTRGRRPRGVTIDDRALYIYTSGTTGLPKAANVSHARLMQWTHWFAGLMDVGPTDRMYNCLPMYHSVGRRAGRRRGTRRRRLGRHPRTVFGAPVLERHRRVGLHAVPVHRRAVPVPRCTPRRIRARPATASGCAAATGCAADVWSAFQEPFPHSADPRVLRRRPKATSRWPTSKASRAPSAAIPPFLAHRFPATLVEVRRPTPPRRVRDARGFCVRCAPNEVGEAIGRFDKDPSNVGTLVRGLHGRGRLAAARSCATSSSRATRGSGPAT